MSAAAIAAAIVAFLVLLGGTFYGGYRTGTAADEAAKAVQMAAVVDVMAQREAAAQTEAQRLQGIVDDYDKIKSVPAVATAGLGQRVLDASAAAACHRAVPGAKAVAGGAAGAAAQPASDTGVDRLSVLTQAVYNACSADADQMSAMIRYATPEP
jgi:hypothetical protein